MLADLGPVERGRKIVPVLDRTDFIHVGNWMVTVPLAPVIDERFLRFGRVVVDLDENDHFGNEAGDTVLAAFAKYIGERLREIDVPSRNGGQEFAILLPETDGRGETALATYLLETVGGNAVPYRGNQIYITVSIEVAQFGPDGQNWPSLYRAADDRRYQAKAAGRDTVVSGLDQWKHCASDKR